MPRQPLIYTPLLESSPGGGINRNVGVCSAEDVSGKGVSFLVRVQHTGLAANRVYSAWQIDLNRTLGATVTAAPGRHVFQGLLPVPDDLVIIFDHGPPPAGGDITNQVAGPGENEVAYCFPVPSGGN